MGGERQEVGRGKRDEKWEGKSGSGAGIARAAKKYFLRSFVSPSVEVKGTSGTLFRQVGEEGLSVGQEISGGHLWALKESLRRSVAEMAGEELKGEVRRRYRELCERFGLPPIVPAQEIDRWTESQLRAWAESLAQEQIE